MSFQLNELLYHKYRTVFHPLKTGKAYGYSQIWLLARDYYTLSKNTSSSESTIEGLYRSLSNLLKCDSSQKHDKLLRSICLCSYYGQTAEAFEKNYAALLNVLNGEDVSDIAGLSIEYLIYILLTQGLFHAALILREKYEAIVLAHGTDAEKVNVYFQNGNFEAALSLIRKSNYFRFIHCFMPRTYKTYIQTMEAVIDSEKAEKKSRFSQYIKGKSVYIIGPSDNQCPVKLPDDCIVIRYAYMGKARLSGCYSANQTNISYYNGMHATTVAATDDTSFLDELQFAVLKYKIKSSFWGKRLDPSHLRIAPVALSTMQHGVSPNMLQIVLMDLMQFGKIDLTVLNNNLYLNRIYQSGYASVEVQKKQSAYEFAAQFAKHDVFCNFKLTKALFERGFFNTDTRLGEILSMTNEEFADAMQKEYGHQNALFREAT